MLFRYRYYVLNFGNDATAKSWTDYEDIGLFQRHLDIIKLCYQDKQSEIILFKSPSKLDQTTLRIENGLGKAQKKLVIHMYPTTQNFMIQGKCCRDWIAYEFKSLCKIVTEIQSSKSVLPNDNILNTAPFTLSSLSIDEYVDKMNSNPRSILPMRSDIEAMSEINLELNEIDSRAQNLSFENFDNTFVKVTPNCPNIVSQSDNLANCMNSKNENVPHISKSESEMIKCPVSSPSLSDISWDDPILETTNESQTDDTNFLNQNVTHACYENVQVNAINKDCETSPNPSAKIKDNDKTSDNGSKLSSKSDFKTKGN